MGKREYFPAYFSYQRTLKWLSDEQLGRVFRAALEYAETGKEPDLEQIEMMGFAFMKEDIDRANEHYEQVCEVRKTSGQKGGRPKSQKPNGLSEDNEKPNGFEENQMVFQETKKTQSESNSESNSESESESKSNQKESIKKKPTPTKKTESPSLPPPTVDEVRAYCNERGITNVNPQHFVDYYSAMLPPWTKLNGEPVKNWKLTVVTWSNNPLYNKQPQQGGYVPPPDDYPF